MHALIYLMMRMNESRRNAISCNPKRTHTSTSHKHQLHCHQRCIVGGGLEDVTHINKWSTTILMQYNYTLYINAINMHII